MFSKQIHAMIWNYLTISLRKLWKQKTFSIINMLGLTLGMTSCMFILMYVEFESSYDEDVSADMYRVVYHSYQDNVEVGKSAQTVPALVPAMRRDLPEVVDAARLVHTDPLMADPVMEARDKSFRESRIYYADSSFLSMMDYSLLEGDAATALADPYSVVLSASIARKYFGTANAVGETMVFHRGERPANTLKVTAVIEDVAANAHVHPDFLVAFSSLQFPADNDWDWGNFYNYVRLSPETQPSDVHAKLPDMLSQYIGDRGKPSSQYYVAYELQPVQDIHLHSDLWGEAEANGNSTMVMFLGIIALCILVIAWVNYINFSVARSQEHIKEVGIRRMSGSSVMQLWMQATIESAMVNTCAVVFAVALLQVLLPALCALAGLPIVLSFTAQHALYILVLLLAGTMLSGIYPAWLISRHRPIALLKKQAHASALSLSKALMVFQFAASIVLIIGTLTIRDQLTFMRQQDVGLNLENTLVVKGPGVKDSLYGEHLDYFRHTISQQSSLDGMSVTSTIPGLELHWGRSFNRIEDPDNTVGLYIIAVDEFYFEVMGAAFAAGGNFPDGTTTYKDAVILNETAARQLGYQSPEEAIGATITWHENENTHIPRTIIGVVTDFNQQSLKVSVEPIIFALKEYLFAPWAGEYYTLKLKPGGTRSALAEVQSTWNTVFAGNPFDYFFLENYYDAQYSSDNRFSDVFELFAALAIFIAGIGLFGLSTYMAIRRTKEIGIRKVLGSSVLGIMVLLSRDFLIWVGVAFAVACPLSGVAFEQWLSTFAYRVNLNPWLFLLAGFASLAVALLTVSWHTWHAARSNPVDALRYE